MISNEEREIALRIQMPLNELRKRKLFLGVPMYGGNCLGTFAKNVSDLTAMCAGAGITLQTFFMFNESLIPRARNYIVDEFMRSDCTHMIFIDADVSFDPSDVLALWSMQIMSPEKYHIIGAAYPKKAISWEKIREAVIQGKGEKDPNELENYVGDYVFNPVSGDGTIKLYEPSEVLELGTGFMMFSKEVLAKFQSAYPQYMYRPDHARSEHFDGSREIMMFFQSEIDPDTRRYLSEDYWFTQKARKIGLKTWLCPWMKLKHTGTYIFGGSILDLAEIKASLTADLKKTVSNSIPPPSVNRNQRKRKKRR